MRWDECWRDLCQADQHVEKALSALQRQEQIVDELVLKGYPNNDMLRLLDEMRTIVLAMCRHREQIAAQEQQHRLLMNLAGSIATP